MGEKKFSGFLGIECCSQNRMVVWVCNILFTWIARKERIGEEGKKKKRKCCDHLSHDTSRLLDPFRIMTCEYAKR